MLCWQLAVFLDGRSLALPDARSLMLPDDRSLRSLMAASGFALAVGLRLTSRSFHTYSERFSATRPSALPKAGGHQRAQRAAHSGAGLLHKLDSNRLLYKA